jgi:FemAB family protein
MNITLRLSDRVLWERTLELAAYVPAAYSSTWIDYQLAYQVGNGGDWQDLSCVIYLDNRPCGVWPISISRREGSYSITSHGLRLLPPIFINSLSPRSCKALIKSSLDFLRELCCKFEIQTCESADPFRNVPNPGLSEWYRSSKQQGATTAVLHELFVDLAWSLEDIRSSFRKSYRALVNSGTKSWEVKELTRQDPQVWESFRQLHLRVAGRVTRNSESWALQHQAIACGQGILVYLLDANGAMVGGGLFHLTRDEAVYAVAAYDRSLFDKPLGHVVQQRAIAVLKARGVRWYKLGQRPYTTDPQPATQKELSIGDFKEGFATHLFPTYILRYEFQQSD